MSTCEKPTGNQKICTYTKQGVFSKVRIPFKRNIARHFLIPATFIPGAGGGRGGVQYGNLSYIVWVSTWCGNHRWRFLQFPPPPYLGSSSYTRVPAKLNFTFALDEFSKKFASNPQKTKYSTTKVYFYFSKKDSEYLHTYIKNTRNDGIISRNFR
jgi:hypothetical protein